MAIDQELSKILKKMWDLDDILESGGTLTESEKEFYNEHLDVITKYYANYSHHWNGKSLLN